MIKLAMYKGKGLIGNAIVRAWTRSIYSHCELIDTDVGRWMSASVMDGGVRAKEMDMDPEHWDVFDLPWADPIRLLEYYAETKGKKYGWVDLLRSQFLNRPFDDTDAAFCSEWCAAALGLPCPTSYSPATLLCICLHLNAFKAKS